MAICLRQRIDPLSAERLTLTVEILLQVFRTFFDYFKRIDIRLIGRVTPGEQSVGSEHDATDAGVLFETAGQLQAEVETRTLPFDPSDGATEEFLRDALAILRRRNGDGRIRMQVVDMFERQHAMQRCVDGRCL